MDESIALMFNNTLQKIFSTSSRKNIQLRDSCKVAQDTIRDSPLFSKSETKHDIKEYEILGNKLYIPMKLACETKEPKIMTIALDCLDKMMSYGMIKPQVIDETSSEKKKLIENIVELIGSYFSFQDENVQLQIIKALLTSVITPSCDVHDTCLMNAIKTSYNIYLVSTNKINSTAAKSALFQMVDSVLQKFELVSQQKLNPSNSNSNSSNNNSSTIALSNSNEEINTAYQTNLSDVILLFRAFCKLSTKDIPDGLHADSHEMKSKMLSLELLSRILENPLPSLKLSEKFINSSIKRYLSNSLLINGTNQHLPVFKLTLTLFLSLIIHFKEYLKEEIGLFFSKILLNVLSSPSCSAKQKWLILPVLYEICKNPQTIVDIFVNYDCDPERKDIFEKMVYELSRVAQGTITGDQRTSSLDDMKFKTLGLECIVTIMKSLVDWSKELYDNGTGNSNKINRKLTSKEDLLNNNNNNNNSGNSGESTPRKKLSSSTSSTSSINNEKDLSTMSILEQGIYKFNQSSKRGIEFLIKQNVIKESPEEIAQFFKSNISNLDPKKIGEYLIQQNSFNFSVLFKYVESFNFKDMNIDESLRNLLFGFLLHSENQCIDKIIEKFAEKYYNDNSNSSIFSNAESVYLLSYSIIILSTDLHNPSIISKMSKSDWIKMNSKSNNKQDFEESFLIGIYERVLKEPFKIINDDLALDSQERLLRFNRENDYIAKQCQELIKAKLSKKSIFYKARNIEHVRPMFLLSWCYVLSTLSVVLDDTKDKKVIQLCLEGFSYAIRVSCIFYMNVERSSFITSLSKFSLLDSIKDPSLKNIECVKTLLSIGITEGNYLQDSWQPILKSICILERFQLFNSLKHHQDNDNNLISSPQIQQDNNQNNEPSPQSLTPNSQQQPSQSLTPIILSPNMSQYNNIELAIKKLIEENPKELSFDSSQIERIFTNTSNLSDDSIVTFFRCLCEVSEDEINHYSRNYSLIKLVEVIEYNFKRIRLVFYNIWEIVVQHFTKVGCNSNIEIAQHSIDSLRQLANKYLEKQELSHYNFQNEFLKPFQDIIKNNPSNIIKELVIRCVVQLSILKNKNIKSGWKTIINVLQLGSKVQNENIVTLSYQGLEQIINKNFELVEENFFIDIINCLSSFSSPSVIYSEISIKALELLNVLSQKVAPNDSPFDNINEINRLLIPILEGTSQSISHENENVRKLSCALLFDLFNIKGKQFDDDIWQKVINQIITPIFSNVDLTTTKPSVTDSTNQWLKTTFPILLNYLIDLFIKFNKELKEYLGTILNLLEPFICCSNELSCQIAIDFYALYISKCSNYFTNDFWCNTIIDSINRIINKLLVSKLTTNNNSIGNSNNNNSPTVSAITPETPKKSSTSTSTSTTENSATSTTTFSRTLSSLKPFIVTEYESSSIGKEMKDNLIKYEKTEPFLSIHNWNIAIKFLQKITEVYSALQLKTPCKFSILLVKNWDIVFILSQRINSEAKFISHFGEANSQNYECSSLSILLSLLFEMYSSEPINEDNIKRSKEVEDILSRLSLGILKENSLSTIQNQNTTSPTTSATSTTSSTTSNTTRIFNNNNIRIIKIICQILQGFTKLTQDQFKKHQSAFFMYFIDLSLHDNIEIRQNLANLIKRCEKDLPQIILNNSAPTPLVLFPTPTIGQKNNSSNRHSVNYQQQEEIELKVLDDQVIIDGNDLANKDLVEQLIEKDEDIIEEKEIVKEIDNLKDQINNDMVKEEEQNQKEENEEDEESIKVKLEENIEEDDGVVIESNNNNNDDESSIQKSTNINNNQISDDFTSIGGSNETITDDGFVNINDQDALIEESEEQLNNSNNNDNNNDNDNDNDNSNNNNSNDNDENEDVL